MRLIHMAAGAAILLGTAFATNMLWRADPSSAQGETKMTRTITVNGEGSVFAKPDMAQISTGVQTEAPVARDALARNSAQMAEIIGALKKMGIADTDLQTSNFSVSPVYATQLPGQSAPPRVTGYQVSNTVTVVVKDLTRLGEILDQVVQLGSNNIGGIAFSIDEPKPLMMQARGKAIEDARARAEVYAKAAGVSVGKVMAISETAGAQPPTPFFKSRMAMSAEAVPVEAGQQEVSSSVTVVFAID